MALRHARMETSAADALKSMMRSMPHSTVLIATLANEEIQLNEGLRYAKRLSPYSQHFRGAIVSSLTSVTLGPPAVVSFNFKEPSATLDGIRKNRFFSVHFLKSDPEGANLAKDFLEHAGDHRAAWRAVSRTHIVASSKGYDRTIKPSVQLQQRPMTPIVEGPGVASHLICEIMPDKCVSGIGDHTIVVAKVLHGPIFTSADNYAMLQSTQHSEKNEYPPLLMYSQGEFKSHGSAIASSAREMNLLANQTELGDSEHVDMAAMRYSFDLDVPTLFHAVHAYSDKSLRLSRRTSWSRDAQVVHKAVTNSTDVRAEYFGALKLWQLQQAAGADIGNSLSQNKEDEVQLEELMSQDDKIRHLAELLARINAKATRQAEAELVRSFAARNQQTDKAAIDASLASIEDLNIGLGLSDPKNDIGLSIPEENVEDAEESLNIDETPPVDLLEQLRSDLDLGPDVAIEEALRKAQAELKDFDEARIEPESQAQVTVLEEEPFGDAEQASQIEKNDSPMY